MSIYPPPENVIPIFNNLNFSNLSKEETLNNSKYLMKTKDDITPFTLTANSLETTNLSATNVNISQTKQNYKTHLPDLFSYYDFSDSSNIGYDASGNNRNAISYNDNYLSEYNQRQNILNFNQTAGGTNIRCQRLDMINYLTEFKAKQNVSISFWIYQTANSTGTGCLFSMSDEAVNNHDLAIFFSSTSNSLICRLRKASAVRWQISSTPPINQWVHVCLTMGSLGAYLYFNGSLVSANLTNFQSPSYLSNADNLLIGCAKDINGIKWTLGNVYLSDFMI
jgi:hypothetical protein